jgi:hypothetical protein
MQMPRGALEGKLLSYSLFHFSFSIIHQACWPSLADEQFLDSLRGQVWQRISPWPVNSVDGWGVAKHKWLAGLGPKPSCRSVCGRQQGAHWASWRVLGHCLTTV